MSIIKREYDLEIHIENNDNLVFFQKVYVLSFRDIKRLTNVEKLVTHVPFSLMGVLRHYDILVELPKSDTFELWHQCVNDEDHDMTTVISSNKQYKGHDYSMFREVIMEHWSQYPLRLPTTVVYLHYDNGDMSYILAPERGNGLIQFKSSDGGLFSMSYNVQLS